MKQLLIATIIMIGFIYMSLHDVDYQGDMREAAMPATHDTALERKADGTNTITQKVDTSNGAYVTTKDASIIVNDGSTNVVQLGSLGTSGQFGLKVAKTGFDVTTTGNANLIFNSNQNIFKVVMSGTIGLAYDGNVNTFVSLPHNLGYIPIVLAYVQFPNDPVNFTPMDGQYVPMPLHMARTGLPFVTGVQAADATNIYFRMHDIYAAPSTPSNYTFRYYVLQETAN